MKFRLESAEARVNNLESINRNRSRVSSWVNQNDAPSTSSRSYRDDGRSDDSTLSSSTLRPEDSASVRSDPNHWRRPGNNCNELQRLVRGHENSIPLRSPYSESSRRSDRESTMVSQLRGRRGESFQTLRPQFRDSTRSVRPRGDRGQPLSQRKQPHLELGRHYESCRPSRILNSRNLGSPSVTATTASSSSSYKSSSLIPRAGSSSTTRGNRNEGYRANKTSGRCEMPFARVWRRNEILHGSSQTTSTARDTIPATVSTTSTRRRRGSL